MNPSMLDTAPFLNFFPTPLPTFAFFPPCLFGWLRDCTTSSVFIYLDIVSIVMDLDL